MSVTFVKAIYLLFSIFTLWLFPSFKSQSFPSFTCQVIPYIYLLKYFSTFTLPLFSTFTYPSHLPVKVMNQSIYLSNYLPHIHYLSDIHLSVIHCLLVIHHIVKVIHHIYFAGHSMLGWGGTDHKAWGKGQMAGDSLSGGPLSSPETI